jgi:hypothetical protein
MAHIKQRPRREGEAAHAQRKSTAPFRPWKRDDERTGRAGDNGRRWEPWDGYDADSAEAILDALDYAAQHGDPEAVVHALIYEEANRCRLAIVGRAWELTGLRATSWQPTSWPDWLAWARAQWVGNSNAKAVLLALATYADAGGYSHASERTLKLVSELPERTLRRALRHLCAGGFLRVERRPDERGWPRNHYWLTADPAATNGRRAA